jgi:hypothetical protein
MFKIYAFYKVYIIVISPFKALFKNALKANFLKYNKLYKKISKS